VTGATQIARVSRVVIDLDRAEAFYRDALGFRTVARGALDNAAIVLTSIAAEEVAMRLGADEIALVRFAQPGLPYPPDSRSDDLWFQHLAIVVNDMDAAYAHLCSHPGWTAITSDGPQLLPPANGGVRAFKFRDPDGHPLELIWFPPGQGRAVWQERETAGTFLGIDHSALAISSRARSIAFYRTLGFRISARSLNAGPAQSHLDGLPEARVRVTGLRPASQAGPGLELLAYSPPGRASTAQSANDIVTDWVTIATRHAPDDRPRMLRDPDGHRLLVVPQGWSGAPA
jgi:catechol 2,3-dioxygenase-like lactoylglutathione lyase family enzyme